MEGDTIDGKGLENYNELSGRKRKSEKSIGDKEKYKRQIRIWRQDDCEYYR